jgi:hypothetical protein
MLRHFFEKLTPAVSNTAVTLSKEAGILCIYPKGDQRRIQTGGDDFPRFALNETLTLELGRSRTDDTWITISHCSPVP